MVTPPGPTNHADADRYLLGRGAPVAPNRLGTAPGPLSTTRSGYPETHIDGSWSSGETRRLTSEQNTEATKACADIHDEGERVVLPAMRHVEPADPNRRLAGLEHMLKKADRLKEKIADVLLLESHLSPGRR